MFSRLHGSIICCLVLAIAFVGSVAARGPAPAITRIPITSLKSTANGETPYGDGTKGQYLAPNTTTTRKFLRETGTGSAGQAPAWDTLVAGDIPNLPASIITSGLLGLARGGTNADLSATGGTSQYVKQVSSGAAFTVGTIPAADVPGLDASKIISGLLALARGGTHTDLSATGGANQILKQKTSGGDISVEVLSASDLSSICVTSVALTMPSIFSVSGSPVTTTGTLAATLATQSVNLIFAGPISGGAATPTFRSLVAADIPNLDAGKITTGTIAVARLPVAPGVVALTDASTITVDASLGNHFRVTLAGNRTMGNPSNPTDGQRIVFELIQDGTGSRTMTWSSKYAWGTDVTVPTLTTTASKRDMVGFIYNSTADKWYGTAVTKGY